MEIIDHKLPSTTFIHDTTLNGIVEGDLTASEGIHAVINGIVTGDLIIRAGSYVDINGIVNGSVINEGGHVKVYGMAGYIRDIGSTQTLVDSAAIIRFA
ncbi:hypothetical protein [Zymomonas sp.]|uniref:hypothetical protein n=1 Tax=Zymomonas sp. TaxID=2068624 RepID=UPI0025DA508B|nr:hypothetical protein [Zymomonas sp.]MCA1956698.1 hypothetical protein [Zymomonas sp.]